MIECTVINTLCCLLLYQAFPLNNNTRQKHLAINVITLGQLSHTIIPIIYIYLLTATKQNILYTQHIIQYKYIFL